MNYRLRVRKLDNPISVAYMRILKHYGAGCYPKKPLDHGDHWNIPIEAYTPKSIIDEKTGKEHLLTFHMENVAEINIEKETLKILY